MLIEKLIIEWNAEVPKCLYNLSHFDQLPYSSLTNTTLHYVQLFQKQNLQPLLISKGNVIYTVTAGFLHLKLSSATLTDWSLEGNTKKKSEGKMYQKN